jgi:hypothetical protein
MPRVNRRASSVDTFGRVFDGSAAEVVPLLAGGWAGTVARPLCISFISGPA